MLLKVLSKSWSLFLGMGFLMLGNGLQGTLVSWRAEFEGFSSDITGFIMANYYVGFLVGSIVVSTLIKNVGHVRVYAALAALASAAIIIQAYYISPFI